jgi:hypothetical protein
MAGPALYRSQRSDDPDQSFGSARFAEAVLLPVNELAINLSPKRIDHRYLKVLVVAEALVAEVLGNFFAMPNRFGICLELDPNCIPMRDAILHIEEKLLHAITSEDTNPVCQDSFRT